MKVYDGLQQPAVQTAESIEQEFNDKESILFLTAGGSSLKVFNYLDADTVKDTKLTVGVLDERLTSNSSDNNFSQLRNTRWGKSVRGTTSVRMIDTAVTNQDTLSTVTDRLRGGIEKWQAEYPGGTVIALVGIGRDGHIAGMIPASDTSVFKERFQTSEVVVGYSDDSIDNEFTSRITTTMTFFRKYLDQAFVYAAGQRKCPVLKKLLHQSGSVSEFPACVLKDIKAVLFTDCRVVAG